MEACFYGTINERYEEIIKHWNSKSLITKHIGRIGGKEAKDLNVEKYLTEVSEHLFKLPFHTDFEFSDGMMRRFKREIDNIESNYKSGSLTGFRRMFYVSDAIANKSPVISNSIQSPFATFVISTVPPSISNPSKSVVVILPLGANSSHSYIFNISP